MTAKRRGDGHVSSSRSKGSSGGRIKSKHFKQNQSQDSNGGGGHHQRDGHEGSERHNRQRRLLPRSSANSAMVSSSATPGSEISTTRRSRRKALDPTLLARGMSARSIGARISHKVQSLSNGEIERDIRHMEAYGAACIAYAQQFFIYANRDLVSGGVYGPVPSPSPGLLAHEQNEQQDRDKQQQQQGGDGMQMGRNNNFQPHPIPSSPPNRISSSTPAPPPGGGITMPVRIDPEEEKRLSLLRKRVAASEARREVLETEYLSLRKHYVHESHLLRNARRTTNGQLEFLRELSKKRGRVLALRRVRAAMARDVLNSLLFRAEVEKSDGGGSSIYNMTKAKKGGNNRSWGQVMKEYENIREAVRDAPSKELKKKLIMLQCELCSIASEAGDDDDTTTSTMSASNKSPEDAIQQTQTATSTSTSTDDTSSQKVPEDLIDIWSMVESQLHEAELSCSEIETPKDLFRIKSSLSAAASVMMSGESITTSDGRLKQEDNRDQNGNGTTQGDSNGSSTNKKKGGKSSDSNSSNKQEPSKGGERGNTKSQKSRSNSIDHSSNHNRNAKGNAKVKQDTQSEPQEKTEELEDDKKVSAATVRNESSQSTAKAASDGNSSSKNSKNGSVGSSNNKQGQGNSNHRCNIDNEDDDVIPWKCHIMPRTPYDVSVYISNLSSVPDGAAGYGCGRLFGSRDDSLIWLPSNIPSFSSCSDPTTSAIYQQKHDFQKLRRLRSEVKQLTDELNQDIAVNRTFQQTLVENRKRSDELSAMIGVLRTEIEAVLNRHNIILDTAEARARATKLYLKNCEKNDDMDDEDMEDEDMEDEDMEDEDMEDDDDDDDLDDDEKGDVSDGGTVIEGEEDEEGGLELDDGGEPEGESQKKDANDSTEEGEIPDEENSGNHRQHQPMQEVIVPRLNNSVVDDVAPVKGAEKRTSSSSSKRSFANSSAGTAMSDGAGDALLQGIKRRRA